MESIIVRRHGDRWSVEDGSGTAPAEEYDTREAAEMAARNLGARNVRVVDDPDDAQLGQVTDPDTEDAPSAPGSPATSSEMPREPQGGL
jgi:hypothetical protein